jgi:pimeloyl-ACP methyl ester carboxylesterase
MLPVSTRVERVTSKDGTPIAYHRAGAGAPLVLVHGTGGAAARWVPLLPALAQQFQVYAVDRRGRGDSGDAADYAIEREFEDIAAVISAIDEPVTVLGHSYGAICALEAALLVSNLRRLILYEPPIALETEAEPSPTADRLQALLDAGDREGVLTTFLTDVVLMPPDELALFRSSPAWPARLAAAHTLPRELRALAGYRFRPDRFTTMAAPTLLLLGGDSPAFFEASIAAVRAALPFNRVAVLPGQQHIAMDTAPELFVREVVAFLSESGRGRN